MVCKMFDNVLFPYMTLIRFRLAMMQVSDTTKVFLVTPKFLRVCKCLKNVSNLSNSSTYAVILNKNEHTQKHIDVDDDMF